MASPAERGRRPGLNKQFFSVNAAEDPVLSMEPCSSIFFPDGQAMKKWQLPIITLLFVAAFVILYFNGLLGNTAAPYMVLLPSWPD